MKGIETQVSLAARFGVSDNAIRNIHARRTWGPPKPKREKPLTQAEAQEIIAMRNSGELNRVIAEKFNITPGLVSQIWHGKHRPRAA